METAGFHGEFEDVELVRWLGFRGYDLAWSWWPQRVGFAIFSLVSSAGLENVHLVRAM